MLEVRLLGQFEVLQNRRHVNIPTRNAQSLFAYLILYAGKKHRREHLAGLFWPDSSEENARSNLRHELWRLRKVIEIKGEALFQIDDLSIAFIQHEQDFLDVKIIENASIENSTADNLIQALSAYGGELLPGFYDEWVFVERTRLQALFETKMARLLEILQEERRWAESLDWARRWIAMDQWSEPGYRELISAYANSGDLAKAAATYERLSLGLQKELGVKPSEQTQVLYKRLKAGWKLDTQKDAPLRGTFTIPKPNGHSALPAVLPRVRRSNLPRPLTSFIGREKEIHQVEHLVSSSRLVTITGPGGVGKTRLAIQVARALASFYQDGAWWVELAGAEQVAQAVGKAIRAPDTPGLPRLDSVIEHLRDKELLLVLDNCEHLVEAVASLAEGVLSECPNVIILATSREVLGVPGEIAWILPSLSLPGPGSAADASSIFQSEAVSLFIERAGEAQAGKKPGAEEAEVIAQICQRLDGIPLAIELAAARMNLLTTQELAARLDQRFNLLTGRGRSALPRHQTLHAAIEWSYDLLSENERILFRRLSIFASSFTLEAAEAVGAGDAISKDDVLSLLGRLVDKSLLTVQPNAHGIAIPTRFRFLDTIYSFGRLKLDETQETDLIRNRHADYFMHLAERADGELLSKNQVWWFLFLQAENDNLREAIEWSCKSDQADYALKIVPAMMWFWYRNGSHLEARDLALKALATPSANQNRRARARTLNTAGFFLCLLGDTRSARRVLEEAQALLQQSTDKLDLAWCLQHLGLVLSYEKEYDLADKAFQEGLAISKEYSPPNANSFLFFYGDVDLQRGDRDRAKQKYEESAEAFRAIGNDGFLAYPLRRLGYLALEQNDLQTAHKYFLESLNLNHRTGDIPGTTASLVSLAALALEVEHPILAVQFYSAAESRFESVSVNLLFLDQVELGRIRADIRTRLSEPDFSTAFAEGWKMSDEQARRLAEEISQKEY